MQYGPADVGAVAGMRDDIRTARQFPCGRAAARGFGLAAYLLFASMGSGHADIAGDPRDQPVVSFAINQALELERSGVAIPWSSPQGDRKGTIVLDPATYPQPDKPCRAYRRTIEQAGLTPAEIRGNGCRIGPALWTVEETVITPAKAVEPPAPPRSTPAALSPPPAPTPALTPPAKADTAKARSSKTTAEPATAGSGASLPAYTLPSRVGS